MWTSSDVSVQVSHNFSMFKPTVFSLFSYLWTREKSVHSKKCSPVFNASNQHEGDISFLCVCVQKHQHQRPHNDWIRKTLFHKRQNPEASNIKKHGFCINPCSLANAKTTTFLCCIYHCTFIVLYFLLLHCLCGQSLLSKPNQESLQLPHLMPLFGTTCYKYPN